MQKKKEKSIFVTVGMYIGGIKSPSRLTYTEALYGIVGSGSEGCTGSGLPSDNVYKIEIISQRR